MQADLEGQVGYQEKDAEAQKSPEVSTSVTCNTVGMKAAVGVPWCPGSCSPLSMSWGR